MSDTFTRHLTDSPSLRHRRNMWSFYGYTVALALVPEQDFTLDFVEAISSASSHADVFLVAIDGSERFANAVAELHAVDGIFLTSQIEDWKDVAAPHEVISNPLFSNPGDLKGVSELKL